MDEIPKKKYSTEGAFLSEYYIYIKREEDQIIYDTLSNKHFNFIYLYGPRQLGKTSLAKNINEQLTRKDWVISFIDIRHTPGIQPDPHLWFLNLLAGIGDNLNFSYSEIKNWFNRRNKQSFTQIFVDFFCSFINKRISKKILFIFDELDLIQTTGDHTDHFFQSLQLLFEKKKQLNISVLLISVSPPQYLLKNLFPSDFKHGYFISLPDFSSDESVIIEWSKGLWLDNSKKLDIGRSIFNYTGGHPFLNALVYQKFNDGKCQSIKDVDKIVNELISSSRSVLNKHPHFCTPADFIIHNDRYAYETIDIYKKILKNPISISSIKEKVAIILQTSGLVKTIKGEKLDVRCLLYREVFDEKWCEETQYKLGRKDHKSVQKRTNIRRYDLPNIFIINTGGTIAMQERDGKMRSIENDEEFNLMYPNLSEIANIDFLHLDPTDGANIFPEKWEKIAYAVKQCINNEYQGFVIAHGTDTMIYTASALALAFGRGLNKPIVFVGSQAPHHIIHGDAILNLYRAVKIASEKIPEVVICFDDLVLRAVRAEKKDDYRFSGFHSPSYQPLAILAEKIEILEENICNFKDKEIDEKTRNVFLNKFENNVLKISQYPGLKPEWYYPLIETSQIKGVIIETLGLGNLPTTGEDYNFLPLIERLKSKSIPVVITSRYPIKPEFMNKYLPASEPLQKGAISAGNMTSAAALTKFMWILPQVDEMLKSRTITKQDMNIKIQKMMAHNYVGEIDKMPSFDINNLIVS